MPPPWSKTGMTSAARNFSWTVDQNAGSKLYEESFAKYNLDRQKLLTLLQEFFPKHVFKDGEPILKDDMYLFNVPTKLTPDQKEKITEARDK